jgi:hypothetical protein
MLNNQKMAEKWLGSALSYALRTLHNLFISNKLLGWILPFMETYSKDTYETGGKSALVGGMATLIEM